MTVHPARETTAVPAAALARLARTRAEPEDLALLLRGLHSRRLVLLKSLLTRLDRDPGAIPAPARALFERHWRLLERTEARHPDAVRDTLDYPAVGNWLARTLAAEDGPALARGLGRLGAVAAAAALRAGGGFGVTLPAHDGRITLPGIGTLAVRAPTARLTAGARTARLTAGGHRAGPVLLLAGGRVTGAGPGWRGLRRLPGTAGAAVRLDDLDPYRAPPEGVGRAALPPAPRAETRHQPWARRWRGALALLRATDPGRAAEAAALVRCLVPLARTGPHGHRPKVSATFRAAPGAVLTTLPDTAADLAAVLVHETQHSKLSVLHDLLPLHRPAPAAAYRVPWRSDLRPLAGVLQGAYAHLALADFWTRAAAGTALPPAARGEARIRGDSYRRQVAATLPLLLESSELTTTGQEFTEGMRVHLASLEAAPGDA
ncbi:aKG-HExxH-type peptide beta-hydroxylase [Streptomyces eurocidicus]|uniref:HEXXH motif-containing protein n=1 Tax=Streptomyces eurocidicus TaxID=66423 RepID=A0A7W8B560_STREU|nr:HEXXH motif-containing putative peptide modification protein [Streptomyces eurocidicus]MBB5117010.1 HEXXH motif-containing protein [Streptomyces eurocidicus]